MRKIMRLFHKSKIIKVWAVSSVAILLIPILFGALFYQTASNTIQSEVETTNSTIISQTYSTIDTVVNEMSLYCISLTLNETVKQLEAMETELSPANRYLPFELSRQLRKDTTTSAYSAKTYVYFPQLDTVVGSGFVTGSHDFYNINYTSPSYSYDQWIRTVKSTRKRFIAVMDSFGNGNPLPRITIIYPTSDVTARSAYVFAEINMEEYFSSPSDLEKNTLNSLYIFDQDNTMVFTNTDEIRNIDFKSMTGARGRLEYKDTIINYVNSDITGLKYVSMVEKSAYTNSIDNIRNILFILLLVYLVLGGTVAFLLVKYNYTPVREILSKIESLPEFNYSPGDNEYKYINSAITEVFDRYQNAAEKLEGQAELMLDHILLELLRGDFEDEDEKLQQLSDCISHPVYPSFCVVLIRVNNLPAFFQNEDMTTHQQSNLAFFLLKNVFCELCERVGQGFMLSLDNDTCAGIVSLSGTKPDVTPVADLCFEFVGFFLENFELDLTLSISDVRSGAWEVSEAYQNALETIKYRVCFPEQAVLLYEDLEKSRTTTLTYHYTTDMENKFISYVKVGNFESAESLLESIFAENFESGIYSISIMRCFIFDIISTMLKTISEMVDTNVQNVLAPEIDKLLSTEDFTEIKQIMADMVKTVCDIVSSKSDVKLKSRVVRYVEENFTDYNLSVGAVADGLGLNQSYVSTAFREQSGEKLIDYINRVRVERSIEYLKDRSLSLDQVAAKVGYLNVRTYMRVFKKHYSLTPSKYRDSNLPEA